MFCVELCLQGKKSFSMILFFIISFLDFDKTSTYTKKKTSLAPDICREHLLKIHCWKIKSPVYWEGIQALQIISTYFLKSILFFLQCPLFLDRQVHSLKYAQRTLYKIFEIVLLNIDHTGIQCHVSLFNYYTGTHVVNNYNGSQCHVSSYKGPSSSIMAFLLALMMARTLSLMYCK